MFEAHLCQAKVLRTILVAAQDIYYADVEFAQIQCKYFKDC